MTATDLDLREFKVKYTQTQYLEIVVDATDEEDARRQIETQSLRTEGFVPEEVCVDWEAPCVTSVEEVENAYADR